MGFALCAAAFASPATTGAASHAHAGFAATDTTGFAAPARTT